MNCFRTYKISVTGIKLLAVCFTGLLLCTFTNAQNLQNDSLEIDYQKINSYTLDGNVMPALRILESYDSDKLSAKDLKFKTLFENRYKYTIDKSDFMDSRKSPVSDLLEIYTGYWRESLLDNSKNYDSVIVKNLSAFLSAKFSIPIKNKDIYPDDTLDYYLKKYISSKGLHTTGFGRTGKYFDLLVWKNQKDTVYNFSIYSEKINTPVIFMTDFITLGWEEYATLEKAYPGGWATREALFCVRKAYDLRSEDFLIRYLCHEGRHFTDYKLFPKLSSADLEYRAKLTELSLLNKELFKIIYSFIQNANQDSKNGHSVANYCVIRDLSKALFHVNFEKEMGKWEKLSIEKINKAAFEALELNTKILKRQGANVENFIK